MARKLIRHVCRKMSTGVDGGLSWGSSVCRPVKEDPRWDQREFLHSYSSCFTVTVKGWLIFICTFIQARVYKTIILIIHGTNDFILKLVEYFFIMLCCFRLFYSSYFSFLINLIVNDKRKFIFKHYLCLNNHCFIHLKVGWLLNSIIAPHP